jgi:signal transduction histidine kinase
VIRPIIAVVNFARMRPPITCLLLAGLLIAWPWQPTVAQQGAYPERTHWPTAWDTAYQRMLRDSLRTMDADTGRVDLLLRLSAAHKNGPKEPCFLYVDSALVLARAIGYRWGEGWALWQVANLHRFFRYPEGPDTALAALRLAEPIVRDLREPLLHRKVEAEFAVVFFNALGQPDSAVAHIDKLFTLLDEGAERRSYRALHQVAELYREKISMEAEAARVRTQHRWMLIAAVPIVLFLLALWGLQQQRARRLRAELHHLEQRQRLQAAEHMFEGERMERARIARELHDGLGALLAAARAQLAGIDAGIKALEGMDLHGKANNLLENAYQEVRRIAHDMMPGALERFGLNKALGSLCAAATTDAFVADLHYDGAAARLPAPVELALYRIAQEALNNSLKHGQASHFNLAITVRNGQVEMRCEDDGTGFDPATVKGGIGLESMRSRAAFLGGTLLVSSTPGRGTRIVAHIPLNDGTTGPHPDRG